MVNKKGSKSSLVLSTNTVSQIFSEKATYLIKEYDGHNVTLRVPILSDERSEKDFFRL